MKKTVLIVLVLLISGVTGAYSQDATSKKELKKNAKLSEVTLSCKLDCMNCANEVKKQLAFTKGVKYVNADYEKDIVIVKYRNDKTDNDKIISSLAEIDYTATVKPCCPSAKKGCESHNNEKTGCASVTAKTDCASKTAKTSCAGETTKTDCKGSESTPCNHKSE
jgi:copper chaperone CopZ